MPSKAIYAASGAIKFLFSIQNYYIFFTWQNILAFFRLHCQMLWVLAAAAAVERQAEAQGLGSASGRQQPSRPPRRQRHLG